MHCIVQAQADNNRRLDLTYVGNEHITALDKLGALYLLAATLSALLE